MLRTLLLAGMLYGFYATGIVWYLIGAFAIMHVVQESIIGVVKSSTDLTVLQQLRSAEHEERQNTTKAN